MSTPTRRGPADWAAIRLRMECADMAMEDALNPPPQAAKAIMDARAKALAKVPVATDGADSLDVVAFTLARESYAVETRFVFEVTAFNDYTPLPGVPDFIIGVANLRGNVLAVVDLRSFFNIPRQGVTDLARVIVLGGARPEFGILADATSGQMQIAGADMRAAAGLTGLRSAYITGVGPDARLILDGAKLLGDARFTIDHRLSQ